MTAYRDTDVCWEYMKCDGLVLQLADACGRARQWLEGKYTGTCEQATYAVKILLTGSIIATIVLFKDRDLHFFYFLISTNLMH